MIEDSIFGIEAGERAGMYVVARRTPFSFSQDKADIIVDNINTIKKMFVML